MKGNTPNGGYTIVEVLIFLAVSSAMFVSAMALIGGQQNKAQFQAAVREVESSINDTLNNVSTGYYRNTADFKCDISGGKPDLQPSSAGDTQGTNEKCIFVGRVLHFKVGGDDTMYNIYDIVGLRQYQPDPSLPLVDVDSLKEAKPTINPFTTDNQKLKGGLSVGWVHYKNAAFAPDTTAGVGIFTTFGEQQGPMTTALKSGAASANLLPIPNLYGMPEAAVPGAIISAANLPQYNPSSGIEICLKSGTTNQHAIITIGGQGRALGTTKTIGDGNNCP